MSARTMKIAFVMEMADDGVTDVPSADAPDGLTDGTGRRQRRIMCDKSQRRAKANRSKKERGDLFVCPISNGQSERESRAHPSHLLCMHPIPCVCTCSRRSSLSVILFALGYTLAKPGNAPRRNK